MITIKSATVVPLTKEFAARFAAMPGMPGEREFDPLVVAKYVRSFQEEGASHILTWSVAIAKKPGSKLFYDKAEPYLCEAGVPYRCDGRRTSAALARVPEETFPAGLMVAYLVWEIDSFEEDGLDLFLHFDPAPPEDDEEPADDPEGEAMAAIARQAFHRFLEADDEEEKKAIAIAAREELEKFRPHQFTDDSHTMRRRSGPAPGQKDAK